MGGTGVGGTGVAAGAAGAGGLVAVGGRGVGVGVGVGPQLASTRARTVRTDRRPRATVPGVLWVIICSLLAQEISVHPGTGAQHSVRVLSAGPTASAPQTKPYMISSSV